MIKERHGRRWTAEYNSWLNLRNRCRNVKHRDYDKYGGRGIKVSERWDKFSNFYADMGNKPSAGHSIDRIDNDGDYTPENCRWATRLEQQSNTRKIRTIPGVSFLKSKKVWVVYFKCKRIGQSYNFKMAVFIRKAAEHDLV